MFALLASVSLDSAAEQITQPDKRLIQQVVHTALLEAAERPRKSVEKIDWAQARTGFGFLFPKAPDSLLDAMREWLEKRGGVKGFRLDESFYDVIDHMIDFKHAPEAALRTLVLETDGLTGRPAKGIWGLEGEQLEMLKDIWQELGDDVTTKRADVRKAFEGSVQLMSDNLSERSRMVSSLANATDLDPEARSLAITMDNELRIGVAALEKLANQTKWSKDDAHTFHQVFVHADNRLHYAVKGSEHLTDAEASLRADEFIERALAEQVWENIPRVIPLASDSYGYLNFIEILGHDYALLAEVPVRRKAAGSSTGGFAAHDIGHIQNVLAQKPEDIPAWHHALLAELKHHPDADIEDRILGVRWDFPPPNWPLGLVLADRPGLPDVGPYPDGADVRAIALARRVLGDQAVKDAGYE